MRLTLWFWRKGESIFITPDETLSSWRKSAAQKKWPPPPVVHPTIFLGLRKVFFCELFLGWMKNCHFFARVGPVRHPVGGRIRINAIWHSRNFDRFWPPHIRKRWSNPKPGTEPETKSTPSQPPKMNVSCQENFSLPPPLPSAYPPSGGKKRVGEGFFFCKKSFFPLYFFSPSVRENTRWKESEH